MTDRETDRRRTRPPGRRGRGGTRRSGARATPRRGNGYSAYAKAARARLRRFRRASALAVGSTGMLLLLLGAPAEAGLQSVAREPVVADSTPDPARAVEEATGTLHDLGEGFVALLPKIVIALALLAGAALIGALLKRLLRRWLGSWERADAVSALTTAVLWMLALGAALSVIAGDATALVGLVGFFGLALSWALQAPIESFSGWMLNSFRGYYRVGDRIEVGDVFGDVARIDVLTTTVWEAGGPGKPVQAAQPTGALITFPNSEVLRANIVNYTRDFPYVWDEVTVSVSNDSDLAYAVEQLEKIADGVLGETMAMPAETYRRLLQRSQLDYEISQRPQVFVTPAESWTNLTIRYLVPARERRVWATRLVLAVSREMRRGTHDGRIADGYPRIEIVRTDTERGTAPR